MGWVVGLNPALRTMPKLQKADLQNMLYPSGYKKRGRGQGVYDGPKSVCNHRAGGFPDSGQGRGGWIGAEII